jgi:hypothetical protein
MSKAKFLYIFLSVLIVLSSCEWKLKPNDEDGDDDHITIMRYDRLESRYLTTGDFSALQQMNTEYPIETRTLVEKMLQIGEVSDPDISNRFLRFFQDSILQTIISDAESEYANMDDISQSFNDVFSKLRKWIPNLPIPKIYTQIGALDQSIVIGDNTIGISLDKYMGAKYPIYKRFGFVEEQLNTMGRNFIVPDGVSFYLLSLYPMENYDQRTQLEKDLHMGKVMWVVNEALGQEVFDSDYVKMVGKYMKKHPNVTIAELLASDDYSKMK